MISNPKKVLGFLCTTDRCLMAFDDGEKIIRQESIFQKNTQGRLLIPFLETFMKDHDITNPNVLVTSKGPGSFTSVRLALSALVGLQMGFSALQKREVLACTPSLFDILLHHQPDRSFAVVDSRRGELYIQAKNQSDNFVSISKNLFSQFQKDHPGVTFIFEPDLLLEYQTHSYDLHILLDAMLHFGKTEQFITNLIEPFYAFTPEYKKKAP